MRAALNFKLLGTRPVPGPPRGAQMFMDHPLIVQHKIIWPWRLTAEQRQAARPLREFFDGSHLDRVIDARAALANAKRRKGSKKK